MNARVGKRNSRKEGPRHVRSVRTMKKHGPRDNRRRKGLSARRQMLAQERHERLVRSQLWQSGADPDTANYAFGECNCEICRRDPNQLELDL